MVKENSRTRRFSTRISIDFATEITILEFGVKKNAPAAHNHHKLFITNGFHSNYNLS